MGLDGRRGDLIDGEGRVRWGDIGHEPFMDVDFLLKECRRLLGTGSKEENPARGAAETPGLATNPGS